MSDVAPNYLIGRCHDDQVKMLNVVVQVDANGDDPEPTEAGPEMLMFERGVYQKNMMDPAFIDDHVIRTVAAPNSSAVWPGSRGQAPTSATPPNPVRPAPYIAPRPPVTIEAPLKYLFDLQDHEHAGIQIIIPSEFNAPVAPAQPKTRLTWHADHTKHLSGLMKTAMLTENRPLKRGDFRAITEALHRRFRGTFTGDNKYVERGYNTVHSYAMKSKLYDALLKELFPERSGEAAGTAHGGQ